MVEWTRITSNEDEPRYYHSVIIVANGKIHYNWHRLSNGDETYYGSLDTDEIIDASEVTHWAELLPLPTN